MATETAILQQPKRTNASGRPEQTAGNAPQRIDFAGFLVSSTKQGLISRRAAGHLRRHIALRREALPDTSEQIAEREAEKERRTREARLNGLVAHTGVPYDYLGANLETDEMGNALEIAEGCKRTHDLCGRLVAEWEPGHKGLTLSSQYAGVGKTYHALAVLLAIIRARFGFGEIVHGAFVTSSDLFSLYRESFRVEDDGSVLSSLQIFERYAKQPDILVLDDLGREPIKEGPAGRWARDKFEEVIGYRSDHKKTTIATTNLAIKGLEKQYEMRMVSRLLGRSPFVEMSGPDMRRRGYAPGMSNHDPFAD